MIEAAVSPRAASSQPPQILLFAEPLLRQGLVALLGAEPAGYRLASGAEALVGAPQLVIWSLAAPLEPVNLLRELERLEQRWHPAPLLLLLPATPGLRRDWLLQLPAAGLLQQPDPDQLLAAVATLLDGGRVVELQGDGPQAAAEAQASGPLGLGQWLLQSGLQQIDAELRRCRRLLDPPPQSLLLALVLAGRVRELEAARNLLIWLWGPISLAWSQPEPTTPGSALPRPPLGGGTEITLRHRTAEGVWQLIRERLATASAAALTPEPNGALFALQGLSPERRRDLLLALLSQLDQLLGRLRQERLRGDDLQGRWQQLQPELRRHALRQMAGPYVQLPQQGQLLPVADTLSGLSDLALTDPDLPPCLPMLTALLSAQPLLVDGRLLAPDEPQALLYLEALVGNWLVRTAELISGEVLACCGDWPELRRYLLVQELLATRSLERLRNQLNARQRWSAWFERPIQLYESRRLLYRLEGGTILPLLLTEPRDQELRQLGWLQQVVTLALETRDALAPQLQALLRRLGDLFVVVLTQVVGRAIGLVGRGILQGMGRSVSRS
ncbi:MULTISPECIES: DUF3685 domain-containing protein [unclassified Synechococcus]|uniref:DUF3685 domain-containing protein n=1 Tax=unclassified Synechococcus TaxID=2626047 RepID=UPI0020CE967C|nr:MULTISPECIES: DUF3685 domain-containing protein [unclassified Synechococcus]